MSHDDRSILDALADGTISRRDALRALAVAGAAIALPNVANAQRGRGTQEPRDTIPLVPPFAPTGWRVAWLDHLSYHCTDYERAAAFYVALMGWTVRSNDGKQAVLDIGDNSGSVIFRGGLVAPPPAALTDAGLGPQRPPIHAVFDSFAWGIEPWDTATVKAELEKRGLNPVADHVGSAYKSFHVKDPDGFDLVISNARKNVRRPMGGAAKLNAPLPFAATNWKTRFVDHLSFEVADYRRSAAFYEALLGWKRRKGPGGGDDWPDSPKSLTMRIGTVAGAIVRANAAGKTATNGTTATIGHISFGIEPWDTERVRQELIKRGAYYTIDGKQTPRDDMAGALSSFHVPDAMGWDLQISDRVKPSA
ncbi:MAG TPA: VOC family protein [Gemmatimonadaceae bacterium]|jgi:catechol 2,3-dioxygenase-like lactoylglutathione lyase family enzyme